MKKLTTHRKKTGAGRAVGPEVIASLKEAIAWAGGEPIPARLTTVEVPAAEVRGLPQAAKRG
jgi:hypothetical protein